ncbi:hypothetical protein DFH08DRAFT_852300 [Mycena albidolilacea]|uniref:Uncharacterized protein n=1 Tax=Mycena albidolilacea TaxID=1033008 RepID=A0AAD7EYW2_9AGAR|nr:hypothetical protein DFH08DRAFT_852300 [Mycena albidolilacea]
MDSCDLPRSWLPLLSWPLEYAVHAFDQSRFTVYSPKHTLTWTAHIQTKPTVTSFYVLSPTLYALATACSLAVIGSLTSLAVFLFIWWSRHPPPKHVAALSPSTVLRIHEIASRQPYHMPPDGDGDPGSFAALPFARSPRKQSLFIFWLLFLVIAGILAYVLRPLWHAAVSSYIVEKHATLSWTFTFVLSVVLANICGRFLQFAFFLVPITRSTIQWTEWIVVVIAVKPAVTITDAYLEVARITQYLSHWYLGIPLNLALPGPIDRSSALVSSAVSAVGGYHLISSRVARNYTLILKSMVQGPLNLFDFYVSLRRSPLFPTPHFRTWAWWAVKHLLRFTLGELSWTSISYPKVFVLLTPALVICAYRIYKYNQVIMPPRTALQIAVDRIDSRLNRYETSSRRRDVEVADIKRLLQNIDKQFANLNDPGFRRRPSTREAPF